MPKSILIEPEKVFASETIDFSSIPVNAYRKSIQEELAAYSPADFLSIWQDMCAIREFETILNRGLLDFALLELNEHHLLGSDG